MATKLESRYAEPFFESGAVSEIAPEIAKAHEMLHSGSGAGSEFTGWLNLPSDYDRGEFDRIKQAADRIRGNSDILIVIGIGGSYLGARAAIEFLNSPNYNLLAQNSSGAKNPQIFFAGNTISPSALNELLVLCEGKDISLNMISKSGTTTEPAIAFRVLRELVEKKYGKEGARERIFCTTDKARGTLLELARHEGYECFVVPDEVGGRYSVLTAVGLLPIAVSGADIDALMAGAKEAQDTLANPDPDKNDCYKYAAVRNILYRKGYGNELFVSFEPSMQMLCEWWKQLYGESEGKENKGIFPAGVVFSTDLHSMGQYIQDGVRNLFETVCLVDKPASDITLGIDEANVDGLNFLSGSTVDFVNKKAFEGTVLAHNDGGVPNLVLHIPERNEFELGYLIYFFEKACAVSGYVLGINPFDQPGVEAYKKNMFALLGKPGYEAEKAALEARLKK